ncbi:hypothetical protein DL765_002692 [Monosporascus sp. GIB2]|nr:hypothetical protein DL765_002692 [Monosporascus sp. GIB2]
MEPRPRHIIIIGGGVIGCTTAYYLTRHPSFNPLIHHITLLEATSIAAAASGKAGGLLGLWAYPECIVPLSYRLHSELAAEHGGAERWGYRRLDCGQISAVVRKADLDSTSTPRKAKSATPTKQDNNGVLPVAQKESNGHNGQEEQHDGQEWQKLVKQDKKATALLQKSKLPPGLDWINGNLVQEYAEMGQPGFTETAQVHPFQFTQAMAALARDAGTDIRIGAKVTRIGLNQAETAVTSISYLDRASNETQTVLGVTDVVVAAGPWTGRVLPRTRVEGLRAHSVVFSAHVSPYAVFTNISLPSDWVPAHRAARGQRRRHRGNVDPEIYARPGGEVYACGEPDRAMPLPDTADAVRTDEAQCDDMVSYIATVSPVLAAAPVAAKQACYLPQHEGGPLVGATSVAGLWVASGHTCWGIQNGPGTGKLVSEFIFDGAACSADVSELDPRKFGV